MRSLSWIEVGEMSALLDRAGLARRPPSSRRGAPPLPSPAVGLVGEQESRPAEPAPAPTPAPAEPPTAAVAPTVAAPMSPPAEPSPVVAPPPPSGEGVEATLLALLGWAQEVSGAESVFVVDDEGLVLSTLGPVGEFPIAAAGLWHAWRPLGRATKIEAGGEIAVKLAEGGKLYALRVETTWGGFSLGLAADRSVSEAVLEEIRAALAARFGDVGA